MARNNGGVHESGLFWQICESVKDMYNCGNLLTTYVILVFTKRIFIMGVVVSWNLG